ncbi:MAG: hypothetical protein J5505_05630, partial [Spirochaetaceae bacterium]|nr:hypothetical protein [Spirochaetaceae bacterium]
MPTVSSPEMPAFSTFPTVSQSKTPAQNETVQNKASDNKKEDKNTNSNNEPYLTAASLADFTRVFSGNSNDSTDIISSLLGKNSSQ